jgi:hypothetical protein
VLALIIAVSAAAVWIGLKFLSQNTHMQVSDAAGGKKAFSLLTPIGSIDVHHQVDPESLGLPIYPGATPVKDKDSANVNLGFGSEASVRVLAAKFETTDTLENVKAFYRSRLGNAVTKFKDKGADGKTVFEIKTPKQERVVTLQAHWNKTLIQLVRVSFGKDESN